MFNKVGNVFIQKWIRKFISCPGLATNNQLVYKYKFLEIEWPEKKV